MSHKAYDAPTRDSGFRWIGEIPAHWQIEPLGVRSPLIVPMRDKPADFGGETPWIRIEDFDGKVIGDSKSNQYVSDQVIRLMNLKVFPVGTVLCSCSCSMGVTAIVSRPLVSNQTFIGIAPAGGRSPDYVYYVVQSAREHLNSVATGAIQKYLSKNDFSRLRIPSPPLREQEAIADFLDRKTAAIDALIRNKERLIKLLQEKRRALITQAVTRGLNPSAPMEDSGIEWLGRIPAHWVMSRLRHVARRVDVGIAEAATHAYATSGVPIIRSTNVTAIGVNTDDLFFIEPRFAEKNRSKYLHAGDIVTIRTGNAGVSAVVPMTLEGSQCFTLLMTTLREGFEPVFYCHWLNSVAKTHFDLQGWGTAQKNISVPILGDTPVPKLPGSEQQEIIAHIEKAMTSLGRIEGRLRSQVHSIREYRQALISAAVTGKIDVRAETAA